MIITRIIASKGLNPGKLDTLSEIARRLGKVRTEIWERCGSINGVGVHYRKIRDEWVAQGRDFGVPARLWKGVLRDTMGDIKAARKAAKVKARKAIRRPADDEAELKRLYRSLKNNGWVRDPYLRRMMRKYLKRGHNHCRNQLVLDVQCYTAFRRGDAAWISVMGLHRHRRIAIPLSSTVLPTGTIRLILRDGRVEVHFQIDATSEKPCGNKVVGIDKGYTEAFVDSDGDRYGTGLGDLLSAESDRRKAKYQRRSRLRAIAAKKPRKAERIRRNNLGRKMLSRRKRLHTAHVRDHVHKAVHELVNKAKVVVSEELTATIRSTKAYGKDQKRRIAGWVKGIMAEALEKISHRRSSAVELVNCAYTSQIDSRNGLLMGERKGDRFYCFDGEVMDADQNAARNVLARLFDLEIDRWTPYRKVRAILQERTERHRLVLDQPGLQLQGFATLSTESEAPFN